MPKCDDISLGRHAVQIIDVDEDEGLVLFVNSWGKNWSKHGYGFLTFNYMKLYCKEIYATTNATVGITLGNYEKLNLAVSASEFAKIWMEKNERDSEEYYLGNKKLNIVWYSLINTAGCLVEVFDLRNSKSERLGWAHLAHLKSEDGSQKISEITELFIWPLYRRKGYGSLLESYCKEYAKRANSNILQMPVYEMDGLLEENAPVRLFSLKLNYDFFPKDETLPCITGYVKKSI
jgi:GNAT superfamily N-acetyltransferase